MIGGGCGRDCMVVGYLYLSDIKHLKPNHQTYDWLANRFRISVRQTTTDMLSLLQSQSCPSFHFMTYHRIFSLV